MAQPPSDITPSPSPPDGPEPAPSATPGHRFLNTVGFILAPIPLLAWMALALPSILAPKPRPNFSGEIASRVQLHRPAEFHLAFLGDSKSNIAALEYVLDDARDQKADAALVMGDLMNHASSVSFRFLAGRMAGAAGAMPFFVGIGNHDKGFYGDDRVFRRFFGDDHFWWRFGRNLFVTIDNVVDATWPDELNWLGQALKKNERPGDRIYLFMHRPPKTPNQGHGMNTQETQALAAVIAGHPVVGILASHRHLYQELNFNGIPLYVTGQAGAPQASSPPAYGYILLDCTSDSCNLQRRPLSAVPPDNRLKNMILYDYYASLPLLSLALWAGLLAARFRRGRKAAAA
jgi:3',5'-cyclic AMP phosphodiesterase CpdA